MSDLAVPRKRESGPDAALGPPSRWLPTSVLLYTLFVILFGAVVRITGSGAGCGQHWPTCHGQVTHLPQSVETAIELTHRVTSGLAFLGSLALAFVAVRRFLPGQLPRRAALCGLLFMLGESLIGAALVLFELVSHNDSPARAVVMAVHLVNTLFLMTALAVAAWAWAKPTVRLVRHEASVPLLSAFALLLLVSASGAVTALGDTLYPVAQQAERLGGAHFLQQLRVVHPVGAGLAAVVVSYVVLSQAGMKRTVRRWSRSVVALVLLQVMVGFINIWLNAPGYLQIVHLALANLIWLALTFFALELHREGALRSS